MYKQFQLYQVEDSIMESIDGKAGIYKIYADRPISRIIGHDDLSLIYIGSTTRLLGRLRDFFNSANGSNSHSGGCFYKRSLENHLGNASEVLKFKYEITDTIEDAKSKEQSELDFYLDKYGELPSLNNQLPKRINL